MHLGSLLPFAVLVLGSACDPAGKDDTALDLPPFCEDATDGDLWRLEGQGGGSTSGEYRGRLVTSASATFDDPNYVSAISFTVENIDVGGTTQRSGVTAADGTFTGTGAGGRWLFKAGASIGGKACAAEMEFGLEVHRVTALCPILTCED